MSEDKRPKIFIGVPCYNKVDPEVLEDWMRFAYHCGRRMPQYDFLLGIKTKSEQFRARIAIVEAAQRDNCDWLLMMDDDMIINPFVTQGPTSDYGFLEKLVAHDKDICGILYYQRGGNCEPVVMTRVGESGYRFLRDSEITHGLQRVDVAGGGCLLIKMKVFDKITPPYFAPEYKWGTDIQLCRAAAEKGMEVWTDTSIEFGHLRDSKTIVTSRNRGRIQLEENMPGEIQQQFVASDIYARLIHDALAYTGKPNIDAICADAEEFMKTRGESGLEDADWYREFPMERVCRQVWFNTQMPGKKQMTEFVINAVDNKRKLKILDFGCGIGIPAFTYAERGHDVTAMDIRGTGTLEFLKWRANKHNVPIRFWESDGGAPALGNEEFDVIVAMDSIEHIKEWRLVVRELAKHLKAGGALFSNNAILEDVTHPEHYEIGGKAFIEECMTSGMMPVNQITYVKQKEAVYA